MRIDNEDDRCFEDPGYMGRTCGIRAPGPVKHSHGPFDDGDIGARCCICKGPEHPGLSHHAGVEISRRPAAYERVMGGIDEVRPGLERLDVQTTGHEGCHQAACDRGLAAAAVRAGDHDPGDVCLHDDVVCRHYGYILSCGQGLFPVRPGFNLIKKGVFRLCSYVSSLAAFATEERPLLTGRSIREIAHAVLAAVRVHHDLGGDRQHCRS